MRAKLTLLSLLMCCILSSAAFAQTHSVSKAEALTIAQRQFQGKDVDYFILQDNSQTAWTIFVDAEPMKGWEHECYVLTVPKTITTSVNAAVPSSKVERKLPPSGNFAPLSVKNRYGTNANSKPTVVKVSQSNAAQEAAHRTYAIILSGGVNKMSNYERYWNDCSFIYQTLVNKYGVPKENIFPIMSDGNNPAEDMRLTTGGFKSQPLDLDNDGVADIKLAATKANIQSTLNSLKTKLGEDDHLFFYVIDHGGSTDNQSKSYICLWGGENLHDYQLASMLSPFTQKNVNVNVVLGQCFSGGFIDDLTKAGCVVATASTGSEYSWACGDIPYDEFVYQWTTAINGANHRGAKVYPDTDKNGRITMDEAFIYAKNHDRRSAEHPQYVSTPLSVGEDLAFNYLAPAVDIYIKDNPEDTGKEPNMTTDEFWKSPSIWVRNQDDGIEIHENPVYSPNHLASIVYVKIHNRGKEKYTGGQWLHVYWAKASTAFSDKAWKGRELYKNEFVTGGHLDAVHIPAIEAGDSTTVKVTWALPPILIGATDNDKHHFCLKTKILPTHIDEKYEEGKSYFDLRRFNDQAQKNVSIIPKEDVSNGTLVFVRNANNQAKSYTLELVPRTSNDAAIYDRANVELELSPTIYTAWERGGFKSEDISLPTSNSNDANLRKVIFMSPKSKLQAVHLLGNEFDVVSLKFDFKKYSLKSATYTFDLIQRDENGEIIGGETFIVESPILTLKPIEIKPTPIGGGRLQLSVDNADFSRFKWFDSQGNTIGHSENIIVTPTYNNNKYTVAASTKDGDVSTESISLEAASGIKTVSRSTDSNKIDIELNDKAVDNSTISIISILDGNTKVMEDIVTGESNISIDVANFEKGVYVVVYTIDGMVVDQKKIDIR